MMKKKRDENGDVEGEDHASQKLEGMDLGSANSMEAVKALLLEGQEANISEDGLLISHQQYQTIQFLYVNYLIIQEEFNTMQEKKLEYIQYKLDYEENKRKWDKKIEAMAGDAIERMRELEANERANTARIAELETENSRLAKENKLFKEFIMNNKYEVHIEKIEDMIRRSEKELIEIE